MTVKYPPIPVPTTDLASLQSAVMALKETAEIHTLQRGDHNDGAVVWRDLINMGLATKPLDGGQTLLDLHTSVGNSSAAITAEAFIRATDDHALAVRTDSLETTVNNPTTGVVATAGVVNTIYGDVYNGTTGLSATAGTANSVYATVNTPVTGVKAISDALNTQINTPTTGIAALVSTLNAQLNTPVSGIAAVLNTTHSAVFNTTTGLAATASTANTVYAAVYQPSTGLNDVVGGLNSQINTPTTGIAAVLSSTHADVYNGTTGLAATASTANTVYTALYSPGGGGFTYGMISQLSTVTATANGVSLKYGIEGTINGVTGGFIFSGIGKNDGSVSYNLEINSNVSIHGSLVVTGSITQNGLAIGAATNKYVDGWSPQGTTVSGTFYLLGTGAISTNNPVVHNIQGGAAICIINATEINWSTTAGTLSLLVNGSVVNSWTLSGDYGFSYVWMATGLPAGNNTFQIRIGTGASGASWANGQLNVIDLRR